MFKILPTKRGAPPSADGKDSALLQQSQGKENARPGRSHPQTAPRSPSKTTFPNARHSYDDHKKGRPPPWGISEPFSTTEREFERMLDDLQIPSTLRPKLATLESPVKAAMLHSKHVMTMNAAADAPRKRLRRSLSGSQLGSASPRGRGPLLGDDGEVARLPLLGQGGGGNLDLDVPLAPPVAPFMLEGAGRPSSSQGQHTRGVSLDFPRSTSHTFGGGSSSPKAGMSKGGKAAAAAVAGIKDLSPSAMYSLLVETSSTQLEVEHVKKLRLMLRNETASWSETFLKLGGYAALLTRLTEILEVEWREEQHDDQILHELLRCFKALSTSSIGCFALRSSCPTPFVQLVSLLYSDKKPGDLCTRQLIVDLLQILFDIYPPSPSVVSKIAPQRREALGHVGHATAAPVGPVVALPSPHTSLFSLVRALLLTPAPPPAESPSIPISPHAFIESLHQTRIFKSYIQELLDLCRDYFWVFCHPQNTIWSLEQTDEAKVERPRAPGGMTGGVEFEAMAYLTTHFHLINSLATAVLDLKLPADNEHSAKRFHADIFASGIERVILTARKASTTYYPTLHLEIARYVALACRARYEIPWSLSRLIGPPPTAMLRGGTKSRAGSPRTSPIKAHQSKNAPNGAPSIPTPKKVEPIKF